MERKKVRVGRKKNKVILDELGSVVAVFERTEDAYEYVKIQNEWVDREDYARQCCIDTLTKAAESTFHLKLNISFGMWQDLYRVITSKENHVLL